MTHSLSHREKLILEEVQYAGHMTIKDLAEKMQVSSMTIHRDVNKLAAEGLLTKVHGEVLLPEKKVAETGGCAMCRKPVSARTAYFLILADGEQKQACCPHCGLMMQMQMQKEHVWQPMATDFLHGHILSANQAFFVIGSELTICCAPSVLTFGVEREAEKFVVGFGGKVAKMNEVLEYFQAMTKSM
ncbi:MAG TPA: DeoR family transcriptional regulator [Anaerolineales bacterium]|nr:DeoR family transcriptional regulator [Anaerolineales bacterium]